MHMSKLHEEMELVCQSCLEKIESIKVCMDLTCTFTWYSTTFDLYAIVFFFKFEMVKRGAGIARRLEHQTHDWKVRGLSPCRTGGRILFSRVSFLRWLLFWYRYKMTEGSRLLLSVWPSHSSCLFCHSPHLLVLPDCCLTNVHSNLWWKPGCWTRPVPSRW